LLIYIVENALRTLEDLLEQIKNRPSAGLPIGGAPFLDELTNIEETETFAINSKLENALKSAINTVDNARHESEEILYKIRQALYKQCGVVASENQPEKRSKIRIAKKLGQNDAETDVES